MTRREHIKRLLGLAAAKLKHMLAASVSVCALPGRCYAGPGFSCWTKPPAQSTLGASAHCLTEIGRIEQARALINEPHAIYLAAHNLNGVARCTA